MHAITKIPIIVILTACWYLTSSSNSVSSQRLFQGLLHQIPSDALVNTSFRLVHAALYLTSIELLFGCCLASVCIAIRTIGSTSGIRPAASDILPARTSVSTSGALHFTGCLFTNCGFALGGASLVQVVKLLEPIETLILVGVVNWMVHSKPLSSTITPGKIIPILLIVGGASLLLTNGDIGSRGAANVQPVIFALISGICMSLRNVMQGSKVQPKTQGVNATLENGLVSITHLMTGGAMISLVATFTVTVFCGYSPIKQMPLSDVIGTTVFFCLYQISSLLVLSLTSAPTHSLLNVGKRIVNVLVATYFFDEHLTPLASFGLAVAAGGGGLYWMEKNNFSKGKLRVVTLLILIGSTCSNTILSLVDLHAVGDGIER